MINAKKQTRKRTSKKAAKKDKSKDKMVGEGKQPGLRPAYRTERGTMYLGDSMDVLSEIRASSLRGSIQLVFTSPPFPLKTKKKYGNLVGARYVSWLAGLMSRCRDLLTDDGSIVVEIGNVWNPGSPTMSTVPLEALLAVQKEAGLHLCQEFVWHNPARLPSPTQWVNIERIRLKDSHTRLWWLSPSERPKADNRRALRPYSEHMNKLLERRHYNAGTRPSQHRVGRKSFFTNNGGAIRGSVMGLDVVGSPDSLIEMSNTTNADAYLSHCRKNGLPRHPARMPVGLAKLFINLLTDEGDLVLDPFAGSNTTGQAAEESGRRWIGIEKDPAYIKGSMGRFKAVRRPVGRPRNDPIPTGA